MRKALSILSIALTLGCHFMASAEDLCKHYLGDKNSDHILKPEPTTGSNLYEILGVEPLASMSTIKEAYRRAAMRFHPDLRRETSNEEHFKTIKDAYETLIDPEKRRTYDTYSNFDGKLGDGKTQANVSTENSPRGRLYNEFMKELAGLSNPLFGRALFALYASERRARGPLEAYLKLMEEWTPDRSIYNYEDTQPLELFEKYFFDDFASNDPKSPHYLRLLRILHQRPFYVKEREPTQRNIILKAKDLPEALDNYLTATLRRHTFSFSVRDALETFRQRFPSLDRSDLLSAMVDFLIRRRITSDSLRRTQFDSFKEIFYLGDIEMLWRVRGKYNWHKDLLGQIDTQLLSLGRNAELLAEFRQKNPEGANFIDGLIKESNRKEKEWDRLMRSIRNDD